MCHAIVTEINDFGVKRSSHINTGLPSMFLRVELVWNETLETSLEDGRCRLAMLVHFLAAGDALIHRLTACKTFLHAVPVRDRFFAAFPAQQNDLALDLAGKIQQPYVEILDLYSDRIDFRKSVFDALRRLHALRLAAGEGHYVEEHSAVQKDTMLHGLQLGIDLLYQLFRRHRRSQQRFQHRKQRLSFIKGECALGHVLLFYRMCAFDPESGVLTDSREKIGWEHAAPSRWRYESGGENYIHRNYDEAVVQDKSSNSRATQRRLNRGSFRSNG
jgi:hypothetical protein